MSHFFYYHGLFLVAVPILMRILEFGLEQVSFKFLSVCPPEGLGCSGTSVPFNSEWKNARHCSLLRLVMIMPPNDVQLKLRFEPWFRECPRMRAVSFPKRSTICFVQKPRQKFRTRPKFGFQFSDRKKKFETDFGPFDPEDNEWDRSPSTGKDKTLVAQELHGLYLLNVFPCISLVEDGDHDPLTKIIQLRSSWELYLAAQHEATQIATSAITRRYSTRPGGNQLQAQMGSLF